MSTVIDMVAGGVQRTSGIYGRVREGGLDISRGGQRGVGIYALESTRGSDRVSLYAPLFA
jgi:hypothetical protein